MKTVADLGSDPSFQTHSLHKHAVQNTLGIYSRTLSGGSSNTEDSFYEHTCSKKKTFRRRLSLYKFAKARSLCRNSALEISPEPSEALSSAFRAPPFRRSRAAHFCSVRRTLCETTASNSSSSSNDASPVRRVVFLELLTECERDSEEVSRFFVVEEDDSSQSRSRASKGTLPQSSRSRRANAARCAPSETGARTARTKARRSQSRTLLGYFNVFSKTNLGSLRQRKALASASSPA